MFEEDKQYEWDEHISSIPTVFARNPRHIPRTHPSHAFLVPVPSTHVSLVFYVERPRFANPFPTRAELSEARKRRDSIGGFFLAHLK